MGFPLPLGIRALASGRQVLIPWAWGMNGATSVLASVLGVAIGMYAGFTVALLAGAAFYALALFTAGKLVPHRVVPAPVIVVPPEPPPPAPVEPPLPQPPLLLRTSRRHRPLRPSRRSCRRRRSASRHHDPPQRQLESCHFEWGSSHVPRRKELRPKGFEAPIPRSE